MTNLPSNAPGQPGSVGENERISEVLAQHGEHASFLAMGIVGNLRDAEDVLQESLLKLLCKARREYVRNPGAYLKTVVRTKALDVLAERQAQRLAKAAVLDYQINNQQTNASETIQDQESPARLRRAIAQLRPRQAEVMIRRGLQEQSYAKIAQEMGISKNTARVYYWKGLQCLQEIFFVD